MDPLLRLLLALALVSTPLRAQYIGISLGTASSTVDWEPRGGIGSAPAESRSSVSPAVSIHWRAMRRIGAATEVRYAARGYAVTEPTLRVDYLQVPLLVRAGRLAGAQQVVQPYLEAGPSLNVQVRCAVVTNNTSQPCRSGAVAGQDWSTRTIDVSAVAGVGLALHVGHAVLLGGVRIDRGLRTIAREPEATRHRATLGYMTLLLPLSLWQH